MIDKPIYAYTATCDKYATPTHLEEVEIDYPDCVYSRALLKDGAANYVSLTEWHDIYD